MKTITWLLLVIVAVLVLTAARINIQIKPGDNYIIYEFPRGVGKPWVKYDSRD